MKIPVLFPKIFDYPFTYKSVISESLNSGDFGRVEHSGSTWQARAEGDQTILKGELVKIIGRDNITWIVQKI